MRRVIGRDLIEEFEIFDLDAMSLDQDRVHFHDKFFTLQFLGQFLQDYFAMHAFRNILCHGVGYVDLGRMNDHQVLDMIADKLISGHLGMARRNVPMLGEWSTAKTETEQEEEVVASAYVEEKAWVEIQLFDDEDKPAARERYRITLPNGKVVEGTTDSDGLASFPEVESGNCDICLLGLDEETWEIV